MFLPLEFDPGIDAQMDWGETTNNRLPVALVGPHLVMDVLELGVPIRVRCALTGLAISLQAVT